VCDYVGVHALKGKQGQKVKRQGHTVMKSATVAWLLVKCAAVAAASSMGLHVI